MDDFIVELKEIIGLIEILLFFVDLVIFIYVGIGVFVFMYYID